MNLYGFAGGDPVNFSDPFGLCPDPKDPHCTDLPLIEISTTRNIIKASAAIAGGVVVRTLLTAERLGDVVSSDGTAGLRRQLAAHRQKLADYIKDPDAADNKGFLRDASSELREKIINSRIRNLEHQIKNFEQQIKDILGGGK